MIKNSILNNFSKKSLFLMFFTINYSQCDNKTSSVLSKKSTFNNKMNQNDIYDYKYVIIGFGIAGQSCLNEIILNSTKINKNDVLIIDPNANKLKKSLLSIIDDNKINNDKIKNIQFIDSNVTNMNVNDRSIILENKQIIKFNKCLLASGALSPNINSKYVNNHFNYSRNITDNLRLDYNKDKLLKLVKNGNHLTFLGSSNWELINICGSLSNEGNKSGYKDVCTIIMPSFGIMSQSLPRYLSSLITKRLVSKGIEVIPYTQIRYIDDENTVNNNNNNNNNNSLELYLSSVYDSLYMTVLNTDNLVIAPISTFSRIDEYNNNNNDEDLLTNVHFGELAGLETDISGGFLVNSSLLSVADIYVAGDIANVRNSKLGRGLYTGFDHAYNTGKIAGRNMIGIRELYDYIPIYECNSIELGINITMIGSCSSTHSMHGYWWTVSDTEKSIKFTEKEDRINENNKNKEKNEKKKKLIGKCKTKNQNEEVQYNNVNTKIPILGLGVVFYVDNDVIVGVLVNGIKNGNYSDYISLEAKKLIGKSVSNIQSNHSNYNNNNSNNNSNQDNDQEDNDNGILVLSQYKLDLYNQNILGKLASNIISPAVFPNLNKNNNSLPTPIYKYSSPHKAGIRDESKRIIIRRCSGIGSSVTAEKILNNGKIDHEISKSNKIAAAFRLQMMGGNTKE